MEKEKYKKIPEFICIIDRSRSMYGKEREVIENFNSWLAQQKQKKSPFLVTLALCNEECELLYCRMPLKYVKPLDTFTYYTKGYTAYTEKAEEVLDLVCDLMPPAESQEVSLHLITDGLDNVKDTEDDAEFEEKLKTLERQGWKISFSGRKIRENFAGI